VELALPGRLSVAAAMARLDRFDGNFSFELRKRQQDVQGGQTTSFQHRVKPAVFAKVFA
jgi:hypothetical protein